MTEIKLTKRYPNSRTEDITDAYMRGWNDALDAVQNGKFHIADRKDEPTISKMEQVEDDAYFLKLMGAVERGDISDAGANQAWYEYINHKTEPQTSCKTCRFGEVDEGYVRCAYYSKATEQDEPQKWETPPKFEHKGDTTTCVSVPAFAVKDEPQTCDHRCVQTEVGCELTDCAWK